MLIARRLDLQYHALRLAFGDQTHFAPIAENAERILDVGTGTGEFLLIVSGQRRGLMGRR